MTKNLTQRILTTVIGIPIVVVLLIWLPEYNFLGFSILAFLVAFLGTREIEKLLFKKNTVLSLLSPLLVLATYLEILFELPVPITDIYLVILLLFFFSKEVISGEKNNYTSVFKDVGNSLIMVFYPSYLITYIIRTLSYSSPSLDKSAGLYFLLMIILVFTNDIFAYIWGMALGKKSRKPVKVSPHKSVAGFVGGHLSNIVISIIAVHFFYPELSLFIAIIMPLCISFTANVGDLVESTLKRTAGVKDSGSIVPGRGGVLDSIDSIIFTTPFFYLIMVLISK